MIGSVRLGAILRDNGDVILFLHLPIKHGRRCHDTQLWVYDKLVVVVTGLLDAVGNLTEHNVKVNISIYRIAWL